MVDFGRFSVTVWSYAETRFQKSGKTEFPTVRQVAMSLRIKQGNVVEASEDCEFIMITEYNCEPRMRIGDKFVETFLP